VAKSQKEETMARLSDEQVDLFRGKNLGTVVTLREDGSPHSTPVWVDTDGENVIFNTAVGRAKERHLRRDPRVAVTVLPADWQQGMFVYVSVTGRAEISEVGAVDHIHRMAQKYLDQEEYAWLGPDEARVIVTIKPEKVDSMGFA
jgi:PPOX class probable F420-dependent enzyme